MIIGVGAGAIIGNVYVALNHPRFKIPSQSGSGFLVRYQYGDELTVRN